MLTGGNEEIVLSGVWWKSDGFAEENNQPIPQLFTTTEALNSER
jgi:hypothetical protein